MRIKEDQFSARDQNPTLHVDNEGTVICSNKAGEFLLSEWGAGVGERLPSLIRDVAKMAISENSPKKIEVEVGEKVFLTVFHPLCEEKCLCISGFDLSDQIEFKEKVQVSKAQEKANLEKQEYEIEVAFLSLMNMSQRTAELVHSAVSFFRERFGLEAVGLRLQEGKNYPYFETSGFPERVCRKRKTLCTRDEAGQPICNNSSNPIKGCMCNNVICGKFDPLKPFFTVYGSFWTNSTTELLNNNATDLQTHMCKRCNCMRYESVALIPLRVDDDILGLLQVNDIHGSQFSPVTIAMWERLVGYLATALAKARIEELLLEAYETLLIQSEKLTVQSEELQKANEDLLESEEKYRNIVETANEGIFLMSTDFKITYSNKRTAEMLGYTPDEILGKPLMDFIREESEPVAEGSLEKKLLDIKENYELKLMCKDGSLFWALVNAKPLFNKDDNFTGILYIFSDITKRKKAETKLKETLDNLENLVEERTAELDTAFNSLKKNQEILAEAQKIAHIGSWEWDIVNDTAYWSDEMYLIFGRNPQEGTLAYNELLNHVKSEDRDYVVNAFSKGPRREPYFIEFRITLPTGEERTVHMRSETIFKEDTPVLMKGIVQDITEHTRSEEKIRNLANIVESSNDAIGTMSPEGIITSWNKGAEKVYGYSVEEVLGKSTSIAAPPHLSDETKKLSERIKHGEYINHYETQRLRKDGKIIDVSITLSPVFDSHGMMTAISFISRDMTESKAVEEKLRESEEKYRNIVETANEGILIINNEAVIIYANRKLATMSGYTLEETVGRSIWDFLSEESKEIVKLKFKNRRLGIDDSYEFQVIRKDGSHLWVFSNSKSLFDKYNRFIGSLSMLTDITERKEAEQALANFEIAREKEIYHRVKNNLQVVSSLLDLHAYKFKGRNDITDSEVIDAFMESQNRVASMSLIHEELYKGKGLDTINFSAYIERLADNLLSTYALGNAEISLKKDLEEDLFLEMDTAVPLGTIVNELVSNSFKHAFSGRNEGEIWIKLHREKNGDFIKSRKESNCESTRSTIIIMSISDNGVGIPENMDIENLDSLGIHLITSLVEQLDGKLEIKRNNGTEFVIRFTIIEKDNKESSTVYN